MDVGLVQYCSSEFNDRTNYLTDLSDKMGSFFKDKFYGDDLKAILIGFTMFDAQAATFFKKKKPKYTNQKKQQTIEGITIETEKALEYEIWLDPEKLRMIKNEKEFLKYVSLELISSLPILDGNKQIKSFDKEKFKMEMTLFLKSKNYLND